MTQRETRTHGGNPLEAAAAVDAAVEKTVDNNALSAFETAMNGLTDQLQILQSENNADKAEAQKKLDTCDQRDRVLDRYRRAVHAATTELTRP